MSWLLASSKVLEQFIIVCFFSDWLHPVYKTQWAAMLSMSQNRDPVPSAEKFGRDAIRCGRILERSSSVSYCCRAWQSSYKHVQMRQYWPIKQVCSGVKFFTPGGCSDFICHASLIDRKILRSFALIVLACPYCARKFICHVIHRARALSTKMNNDMADGHC